MSSIVGTSHIAFWILAIAGVGFGAILAIFDDRTTFRGAYSLKGSLGDKVLNWMDVDESRTSNPGEHHLRRQRRLRHLIAATLERQGTDRAYAIHARRKFIDRRLRWADACELFFVVLYSAVLWGLVIDCKINDNQALSGYVVASLLFILPWFSIRLATISTYRKLLVSGTEGYAPVILAGFVWMVVTVFAVSFVLPSSASKLILGIASAIGFGSPLAFLREEFRRHFFGNAHPIWLWIAFGIYVLVVIFLAYMTIGAIGNTAPASPQ